MRRAAPGGFSLLEVLVALAILGLGVALALSVISGSLANIRKVQLRARTVQHAETVMELSLLNGSIKGPTTLHGDFEDGTTWTVVVSELPLNAAPTPGPAPALPLQQVELPVKLLGYTVEVVEPGSHGVDFRLQTVKLVSSADQGLPAPGGIVR